MDAEMRALALVAAGRAEWREAAAPALGSAVAALVRPLAVTACALDTLLVRGTVPVALPLALGHEFTAEIVDTGDAVTTVAPGDHVLVPFEISCGECGRCRAGMTAVCERVPHNSMYGLGSLSGAEYGGALADLVRVPFADAMCVAIPSDLPSAAASLGDNTTDAWRAIGPHVAPGSGTPVLVVGHGFIGLAAVAIARALGSPVDYLDDRPAHLAVAERLGASVVEGPFPKRRGAYPVTVHTSGTRDGLACALRSTDAGGVCTDTGILFEPMTPIPLLEMYDRGVTLVTGRCHVRRDLPAVLDLVATGRLDPGLLIQTTASWDEADRAMSEVSDKLLITR